MLGLVRTVDKNVIKETTTNLPKKGLSTWFINLMCWPKVTITRFYNFDDNKTCVVICTNQVQVVKFISGF